MPVMRGRAVLPSAGVGPSVGAVVRALHSLKLRFGYLVTLVDVKTRLSLQTVLFGSWLRVGMVLAERTELWSECVFGDVLLVHELKSHSKEINSGRLIGSDQVSCSDSSIPCSYFVVKFLGSKRRSSQVMGCSRLRCGEKYSDG
ncbi:hypothetical protein Bca4012_063920 [Brassica carinata]